MEQPKFAYSSLRNASKKQKKMTCLKMQLIK